MGPSTMDEVGSNVGVPEDGDRKRPQKHGPEAPPKRPRMVRDPTYQSCDLPHEAGGRSGAICSGVISCTPS